MNMYRIIFLIVLIGSQSFAAINLGSEEIITKVGDTTTLHSSVYPSDDCVLWIFHLGASHHRNHIEKEIYDCQSGVNAEFRRRFRVHRNISTGKADLQINNVSKEDAGTYECQDQNGYGSTRSIKLFVLSDDPKCESSVPLQNVIGPNDCGIPPDDLVLTCSVGYHAPTTNKQILQWRRVGDNQTLDQTCQINHGLSCTARLKATQAMNGTSYICTTTQSATTQYSCTTEAINILYIFKTSSESNVHANEELLCKANSSMVCKYTWKKIQRNGDDDRRMKSYNGVFTPTEEGSFRCEADCMMRNQSCVVFPRFVQASSNASAQSNHRTASSVSTKFVTSSLRVLLTILSLLRVFWCEEMS